MSSDGAKGTRSLAILVIWSIWCERNARIFNDKEKKLARLVDEIKESANLCSTRLGAFPMLRSQQAPWL
ncbi:hypothetical protein GQ55_8G062100 [Panicum hallii var. hallii]|uniref:Uncharacterized protein n=1 Tax=Panicum hallii var. hallii TaxID=1504633 RepID=A0A2T7CL90_9POAL|nr:hypothetical protein GQ55_8G062100 [Panicum hallii var. hallii]